MVSNRALSIVPTPGSEIEWWNMTQQQAGMLVKTGFLPDSIKTPEQAIAIMMKGRELGIPSMYALSNIVIIKGKPTCNSELMLALIYRDHGDGAMRFVESTNAACKIAYKRAQWAKEQVYGFTAEDAQRAGLMNTDTWKKYTAAMLRARCISAVARMAFPDSIAGMYTPEELGATVDVNDDGDVAVITVSERRPRDIYEAIEAGDSPLGVDDHTGELIYNQSPAVPMITKKQIDYIHVLKEKKGLTDARIKELHGKKSAKDLTLQEASNFIGDLEQLPDIELDVPDDDGPAEEEYDDRVLAGRRAQATFSAASDPDRFTR